MGSFYTHTDKPIWALIFSRSDPDPILEFLGFTDLINRPIPINWSINRQYRFIGRTLLEYSNYTYIPSSCLVSLKLPNSGGVAQFFFKSHYSILHKPKEEENHSMYILYLEFRLNFQVIALRMRDAFQVCMILWCATAAMLFTTTTTYLASYSNVTFCMAVKCEYVVVLELYFSKKRTS